MAAMLEAASSAAARSWAAHMAGLSLATASVVQLAAPGNLVQAETGVTLLHMAALDGDLALVQALLDCGADLASPNFMHWTPLHCAAWGGQAPVAAALLRAGASPLSRDEQGRAPLHLAAWQGHHGLVHMLVAAGAPLDAADCDGCTALHLAVVVCKEQVVRALGAAGASVDDRDMSGRTPLQLARRNPRLVVALVQAGGRDWAAVPAPCPGLERALLPVLRSSPAHLPQLAARLQAGVQARVRAALLCLQLRTPLPRPLLPRIVGLAFAD